MGMLIEGLNQIRTFFDTLMDAAELGTGTTTETSDDTDLETPIAGSETTNITTSVSTDQFMTKQAILYGVNAGGESATEVIFKTQSPEKAITRVTFPAQTYNTSSDLDITSRWYFRGRRD